MHSVHVSKTLSQWFGRSFPGFFHRYRECGIRESWLFYNSMLSKLEAINQKFFVGRILYPKEFLGYLSLNYRNIVRIILISKAWEFF